MTPKDVSVVIPALNEEAVISAAIQSAWENGAGQVVVSDGGSTDRTVEIARHQDATIVECDPGRGQQLACGARTAQGALFVFLHADNSLQPGCLDELASQANKSNDPQCFWGGFRQQIDHPALIYRTLEWGNAARIRFRGIPFGDQALFAAKAAYERVGGFQPLPLMEDVLLSKSLRQLAWPVLIDKFVSVDSRRWKKRGVVRQTLRNWGIQLSHRLGVPEHRLTKWYR